jgi:biotin transport system substrate-specific component
MPVPATPNTLFGQSLGHASTAVPVRVGVVVLGVVATAVSAQFTLPVPMTDVPFTLAPLAVMLTGAALGSWLGALTQALYLAAGAAGLHVFAPAPGLPQGALRLLGPTGGYLLAYPLAAFVTGWLSERGWDRRYLSSFAAMMAGLAVIYAGGVLGRFIWMQSISLVVATSVAPFLIADVLKAAAAAMILPQTWRLIGSRAER